MGEPLHVQVARHPATAAVTTLCVGSWLWLLQHRVPAAAVGLSYQRFTADRQWWRALTAQVCHLDLLHLVLNVSGLWGVAAAAEPAGVAGASLEYLRVSVLLLLASSAICLALHHAAVAGLGLERMRHPVMVGYSCVLFGWMTLLAWRQRGHGARFGLLGVASVPMAAAPFLLLLVTQVVLPSASFLGHLSGILAGLLLASGCLNWLTPYWTAVVLTWVAIGICYGLALEGRLGMPYVRLLPYGGDGAIEDGFTTDAMERGVSTAAPAAWASATGMGTAHGLAAGVGAAASTAAAAAARQLQTWVGWARQRGQQGPAGSAGSGPASPGLSAGPPTTPTTGGTVAAVSAAAGPALPWARSDVTVTVTATATTAGRLLGAAGSGAGPSGPGGPGSGPGAASGGGPARGGTLRGPSGWGRDP